MKQFTIKEFMDRLQADALKSCTILGLAKKSSSATEILFKTNQGGSWIKVPVSQIGDVTFLKNVHYGEESYPWVKLHIAEPTSTDGKVLYELLGSLSDHDHCHCQSLGYQCGCGGAALGFMQGGVKPHYYGCGYGQRLHGPSTCMPHK